MGEASDTEVLSSVECMDMVAPGVVEGQPPFQRRVGRDDIAQIKGGDAECYVGLHQQRGVMGLLGQAEELLSARLCGSGLPAREIKSPQRVAVLRGLRRL